MHRRVALVALATTCVGAFAGCTGGNARPVGQTSTVSAVILPRVTSDPVVAPQAHLGGVLRLDGNCLYVDDGVQRWLLVYYGGSTRVSFDPPTGSLTLNGATARLGDSISAGGGALESAPTVAAACPPAPAFLVAVLQR